MLRSVVFFLSAGLCLAQALNESADQPPPGVDQALRARITEFFQDHVDGKFRQAEALVAEDTKDYYYSTGKPKYLSFNIQQITYSNSFTRAKALVICEMFVVMPGFTDKPLKVPIGSDWELIDGQWYWHVDSDALLKTPFGKMAAGPSGGATGGAGAGGGISIPTAEQMQYIFTQVKADKQAVDLKPGESAQVTITNTATGLMDISVKGDVKGVDAKLDTATLKSGAKAVLTIHADASAIPGKLVILVEPTGQIIPIQVNIQ